MTIPIYYWFPPRLNRVIIEDMLKLARKSFRIEYGVTINDRFQVRDKVNELALEADPETEIPLPAKYYLAEETSAVALHAIALFVEEPEWIEYPEGRCLVDLALCCGKPVFVNHCRSRKVIASMTGIYSENYLTWELHEPGTNKIEFMSTKNACFYLSDIAQ